MKERINKWKAMFDKGDAAAQPYLEQITAEAKAEGKVDEMAEVAAYLIQNSNKRLDALEASVTEYTLHRQLGDLTEVVNLAYVARHYFGKTRQWLYQRLKGQIVNGKPAQFSADEEATFYDALSDIGLKINAFASHSAL